MSAGAGPAASGARMLGDDYQHLLTWLYAAQLLRDDPDVVRIELEKHGAGNVDDLVVHRRAGRPDYHQVKFTTKPAGEPLTADWFTDRGASKKSPLQRFHESWLTLIHDGMRPQLVLHTNRQPAAGDPILACLSGDKALLVPKLARATPTSDAGKARAEWAAHLGIEEEELLELLGSLEIRAARASITELQEHCRWVMDAVGLIVTAAAIDQGMLAARRWIEEGVRDVIAQTVSELVDALSLRSPAPRMTVLIQAIDRDPLPELADVALDWVDAFEGEEPGSRRRTTSPDAWNERFAPELEAAQQQIRAGGVSHVRLAGAFRLTTALYAGAIFSDTRGYTLATSGRAGTWSGDVTTDGDRSSVLIENIETSLGRGSQLAVGLSVSADLSDDVLHHIEQEGLAIDRYVSLRVPEPGRHALAQPAEMRGWTDAVTDALRALGRAGPDVLHLFVAAPRPAAMLIGHQWNRMPPVQLWEEIGPGRYLPAFRLAGWT